MSQICRTAELAIDYNAFFATMMAYTKKPYSKAEVRLCTHDCEAALIPSQAITSAAVKAAMNLDSPLGLVLTNSGRTARYVAKYKPHINFITITASESTARQCLVSDVTVFSDST